MDDRAYYGFIDGLIDMLRGSVEALGDTDRRISYLHILATRIAVHRLRNVLLEPSATLEFVSSIEPLVAVITAHIGHVTCTDGDVETMSKAVVEIARAFEARDAALQWAGGMKTLA